MERETEIERGAHCCHYRDFRKWRIRVCYREHTLVKKLIPACLETAVTWNKSHRTEQQKISQYFSKSQNNFHSKYFSLSPSLLCERLGDFLKHLRFIPTAKKSLSTLSIYIYSLVATLCVSYTVNKKTS